jgi:hypothetical protein
LNGIPCPNGICPCSRRRRRLLQESTTMGVSVTTDGSEPPIPDPSKAPAWVAGLTIESPTLPTTTSMPQTTSSRPQTTTSSKPQTTSSPLPQSTISTPPESESNAGTIAAAVIIPLLVVGFIIYIFRNRSEQHSELASKIQSKTKTKKKKFEVIGNRIYIRESIEPLYFNPRWYKNDTTSPNISRCPNQGQRREPLPRLRLQMTV